MAKKKSSFWADFKAFITRGNVLDMAVGVVVGGAFGKITSGLVNYVINPCISLLTGGVDLANVKTVLVPEVTEAEALLKGVEAKAEVAILWGNWIQTIIDFLIIAFSVFCFVRAFTKASNKINEKKLAEKAAADAAAKEKAAAEKAAADAVAAAKEAELAAVRSAILEIRDSLKKK